MDPEADCSQSPDSWDCDLSGNHKSDIEPTESSRHPTIPQFLILIFDHENTFLCIPSQAIIIFFEAIILMPEMYLIFEKYYSSSLVLEKTYVIAVIS